MKNELNALRGKRDDAGATAAAGLLGEVVPGGFDLAQDTLSSSPGVEDTQTGEDRSPLESGVAVQPVEHDRSMQEPVHTSIGTMASHAGALWQEQVCWGK